jgi:hypothetical protein
MQLCSVLRCGIMQDAGPMDGCAHGDDDDSPSLLGVPSLVVDCCSRYVYLATIGSARPIAMDTLPNYGAKRLRLLLFLSKLIRAYSLTSGAMFWSVELL